MLAFVAGGGVLLGGGADSTVAVPPDGGGGGGGPPEPVRAWPLMMQPDNANVATMEIKRERFRMGPIVARV